MLPVTLSLAKLNARFIWSYLTGGETGADAGSFWSIGGKTSDSVSGSKDSTTKADHDTEGRVRDSRGKDGSTGTRIGSEGRKSWDLDEISESGIEKWKSQKQAGPVEEGDLDDNDPFQPPRQRQAGEEDDELLLEEGDLVEGLVIIGLCMVVGYLMYVRQFRFANQGQQQNQQVQNNNNINNGNNNNNNNNRNNDGNDQNQPPAVEGLPGDPHAPGRYAYYAAGG